MATFSVVLLSNWVVLPFRNGKYMHYCFTYFDLIVFSDLQYVNIYSEIISASGIFLTYSVSLAFFSRSELANTVSTIFTLVVIILVEMLLITCSIPKGTTKGTAGKYP